MTKYNIPMLYIDCAGEPQANLKSIIAPVWNDIITFVSTFTGGGRNWT